jgi:hypothetical protein
MANAVLLTLQEYDRPVDDSKRMGQLSAMRLALEVWTSLGPRLATHAPVSSALPGLLLGFGWIAFPSSSHGDWSLRRRLHRGVRGTSVSVGSRALVHDVTSRVCLCIYV